MMASPDVSLAMELHVTHWRERSPVDISRADAYVGQMSLHNYTYNLLYVTG